MKLFRPTCAAALAAALACSHVVAASAFTPSGADKAESTPLQLGSAAKGASTTTVSTGGSITRTLIALVVVIGLIYAVTVVLRKLKRSQDRRVGSGLETVASVPLAPGRTLQLVRAGTDFVLVGVAENNVTPIRRYSEEEARIAGLIADDEDAAWRSIDTLSPRTAQNLSLSMGGDAVRRDASVRGVLDTLRSWTVRS